jgi:hypothetical protein
VTASLAVSGCPAQRTFSPVVLAHASLTGATARPSFTFDVARKDGEPYLTSTGVKLPLGLLADIGAVTPCANAAANGADCGAGSAIGTVKAALGAGTAPFEQSGTVYLTEGYKGAPYGLAIVLPTTAGPFTLAGNTGKGLEVVRAAIDVDPETTAVSINSDPLPQVIDGVPIRLRNVEVTVDRPGFMLNPSNCKQQSVEASIGGAGSANETSARPFAVTGCKGLGFKPGLKIKLKGGTTRSAHPALTAVVSYPKQGAYANIARASVGLPHSEILDQAHIQTVCTRVQFAEGNVPGENCPKASIYGKAKATTPLLNEPLSGPVYLRSSSHTLPDLVASLNGPVSVVLDGRIDTDKADGIRTTFEGVPDAPISKFTLEMKGGKKGLLVNSQNICKTPQRAVARLTGQNGKVDNTQPLIANDCGRKSTGKK